MQAAQAAPRLARCMSEGPQRLGSHLEETGWTWCVTLCSSCQRHRGWLPHAVHYTSPCAFCQPGPVRSAPQGPAALPGRQARRD